MVIPETWARLARLGFWTCLVAVLLLAWLPVHDIGARSDVVNHAFAFFCLFALARSGWLERPQWQLLAALLLLGGLIEVVQYFVGRDADWRDICSDAMGLALSVLLLGLLRLRPMRLPK